LVLQCGDPGRSKELRPTTRDKRIFSTGCADENAKLTDCYYDKKDWRACKQEVSFIFARLLFISSQWLKNHNIASALLLGSSRFVQKQKPEKKPNLFLHVVKKEEEPSTDKTRFITLFRWRFSDNAGSVMATIRGLIPKMLHK
jgi:hypothetical protein